MGRSDHARGGARQGRAHRAAAGSLDPHDAAVRLDDQKLAVEAAALERGLEPVQVARDLRLEVGVERGCREAFELPDLGQDLMRGGDMRVGPDRADGRGGGGFVRGVRIGVGEEDGDGFAAIGEKRAGGLPHGVKIDVRADYPVGERPFGHFEPQVTGDDGHEISPEPPGPGPVATTHLEHVAQARSCDDPCLRALAFEKRVRPRGGAMDHDGEVREVGHPAPDPREEPARLVGAGRRDLGDLGPTRCLVEDEDVGECAAHVDADHLHRETSRQAGP